MNMGNMLDSIIKTIQKMSGKYSVYEIFSRWVKLMALAFANQVQFIQQREKEYIETIESFDEQEQKQLFEMTAWLIETADNEMFDMLGYIYMHLELGSKNAGQFFTPYHLCQLMAEMQQYKDKEFINEPSCGAGGNIIAVAETMKKRGINYQKALMVECQDIDIKAVYMTYVQLFLYGIPGVVYQTDTLQDPSGKQSATGKLYTYGYVLNYGRCYEQ